MTEFYKHKPEKKPVVVYICRFLSAVLQNVVVPHTPCWASSSPSPSLPWEFLHSASSIFKVTEPSWTTTPCTGVNTCVLASGCDLVGVCLQHQSFGVLSLQGDDRRHHAADPRCPDWAHWTSGHSQSFPPLHHSLHSRRFHPAVHAGDRWPNRAGPGSIQRQVRPNVYLEFMGFFACQTLLFK